MFDTILVPLDGSAHAEAAIPFAADEAHEQGASLVLLRVVVRPEPCRSRINHGGPVSPRPCWSSRELATEQASAAQYLRDIRSRYRLPTSTQTIVAVGEPVPRVRAEAGRRVHPLVVMTGGDLVTGTPTHVSDVTRRLMATKDFPILVVPTC